MQREEMTRVRRELGLDLVEAGRKAGVAASFQPPGQMKSDPDGCEVGELRGLYFTDVEKFNAWSDPLQMHGSYQVSARVP